REYRMEIDARDLRAVLVERDVADEVLGKRRVRGPGAHRHGDLEPLAPLDRVRRLDLGCVLLVVRAAELAVLRRERLGLHLRDYLFAICGLHQLERRPAQQLPHDFPIVLVVLDVEHGPVPHESSPSMCRGTVKKNVDPLPSSLSTPMRPPCISTSRFVMLSPRPVPPYSRVIVV